MARAGAGYAIKTISKAAALGVGCIFILLQVLAWYGYIDIKWGKIQKDAIASIDTDNDGKVQSLHANALLLIQPHVHT